MSCPLLSLSWPSGSLTHAFIRRLHSLRFPPIMCNRSPAASRPSFFARVADAMSMLQPTLRPECCVASLVLPHIHAPWISFYTIAFFFNFPATPPVISILFNTMHWLGSKEKGTKLANRLTRWQNQSPAVLGLHLLPQNP